MTTASKRLQTTAIGSLPHPNIDSALGFAFRCDVPFLPQIPRRNPWEYMIAQACEGLPGLEARADGAVLLDLAVWSGRMRALNQRLDEAFARTDEPQAFEGFEPSNATSSSWQPFLFELEERQSRLAKIQIAGPLTSQWSIVTREGKQATEDPELSAQIFRLVLARAIAMVRRLKSIEVQPLIFLDEPGLYAARTLGHRQKVAFRELGIFSQTLQREGALVGVHCCSNTAWDELLALGLDVVSLDAGLSLDSLLAHRQQLDPFLASGGRLALGIVPTAHRELASGQPPDAESLCESLRVRLEQAFSGDPSWVKRTLSGALLTPACGLGLHTVPEAEEALSLLQAVQERLSHSG